jgi:predicted methyltransferase
MRKIAMLGRLSAPLPCEGALLMCLTSKNTRGEFTMRLALLATAAGLALATPAIADDHMGVTAERHQHHAALKAAVASDARGEDAQRDQWRHPFETLDFFQVKPGMTVVDYMPAGGWYTRILVPYLGSEGRYVGLTPDPAAADAARFGEYFGGLPGKFEEASPGWNLTGAPMSVYASQDVPEAMAGTVDRALIFREMHNLLRSGVLYTELTRIRSMLKDDGMLGIVQHRANEDAPGDYTNGSKGYLRQEDVIALVEAHGFELVGMSDINANPADPANWEGGVWTLAPSNSGNVAEAAPVGESDRMTLLFAKR